MKKSRKKGWITAADVMAKLEADPEWVAARARKEAERLKRVEEVQRAAAPLFEALRKAGCQVESFWDVVNTTTPYERAFPVLLEHWSHDYPPEIREGIARALAFKEAQFARPSLMSFFRQESNEYVKDALACAIAETTQTAPEFDELLVLLRDPSQGPSRILLLPAISRLPKEQQEALLEEFSGDGELAVEVREMRKRLRKRR